MKLFIKHMVSERCKTAVKAILSKNEVVWSYLELGEVGIVSPLSTEQVAQVKSDLANLGFEWLEDRRQILVERIVTTIINMVHYNEQIPRTNYSVYLSTTLAHDYTYLANTFSSVKNITIEHFIIRHKIERVKELMQYGELTLSEIAFKLNYSSIAHLSNQFKKITGIPPSQFKNSESIKRNPLEDI